jgi:hypothetical protein
MDTCPGVLTGKVGSVIADIERPRQVASLWSCRRMRIWTSPGTIGTVINHTASDRMRVLQETVINKKDTQTMEAHGITCAPKSVYSCKGFKYERLDDAVRYAEIDAKRVRNIDVDS